MGIAERYRLSDRYTADQGTVFMTGIQALARLPLEQLRVDREAGLRTAAFVSGYPGSPLGGYDQAVAQAAREASDLPIVCRPALNEEYAASAVMGSQLASSQSDSRYDGVIGIWYGKAPGVDRASDALRHAVYTGSHRNGGAVALVGDDPSAKSSTVPSSSAGSLFDMHIPMLYPGDPEEVLDLGRHAIALARATGLWTSLKIVADVADGSASVRLNPGRVKPQIPLHNGAPYVHVPDGRLLTPHTIDLEREIYEIRYKLAVEYASSNRLNCTTVDPSDAWIGIVASGITYREVREALRRLGLTSDNEIAAAGIRLLKMQMPLPFNPVTMRRFASGLSELLVIEEKQPNIESLVKDALYNHSEHPLVVGKFDEREEPLLPGHGSLAADDILPALRRRLTPRLRDRLAPEPVLPQRPLAPDGVKRTPFYCSGCPHNRSTQTPKNSLVAAGIGCHTMAILMDPTRVGEIVALTCMGNEGTQWIGMSEFVERNHLIQNLGDGTYFHSGQLAVQAAVASGVSITYKLLWNGAVAMTGGQAVQGRIELPALVRILLAQGVSRVLITTEDLERYAHTTLPEGVEVWDRSRLIEAQEVLARVPGVTVLIHDQACAAEARRARKRGKLPTPDQRVVINPRICEGCGDCGEKSSCLSVQPMDTPFGRKTRIDQTSCNLDFSCLEGDCPSFMTVSSAPKWQQRLRKLLGRSEPVTSIESQTTLHPPEAFPEPSPAVDGDEFAMRITGIGGTGVVTVSQVLGTAAMFDGYAVRGLDQIGLSQKAGPVVSDLRLRQGEPSETNRIGAGQAHLLLAFDQLVAASPMGSLAADPERTAVVGSCSPTPTGEMITHPDRRLPDASDLAAQIAAVSRSDQQHWADAARITTQLFGDAVTANIFVVGMALQAGCLPLRPESVERAIELNGVSIERNRAAFRWGRAQISHPEELAAALAARAPKMDASTIEPKLPERLAERVRTIAGDDSELGVRLTRFAHDLIGYQSEALAADYLAEIEIVARREASLATGSNRLTHAVAVGLHKLWAYKDEYEVARLMLSAEGLAPAQPLLARGGRMAWQLHPPLLRALGLQRKIGLGAWARPFIWLLALGKRLRGTRFDPFGYTAVRRLERDLAERYSDAVRELLTYLNRENVEHAIEIAELPDQVRGYEDLKLERGKVFEQQLAHEVSRFLMNRPI